MNDDGKSNAVHRRDVLRGAGGVAAGAALLWAAPSILSVDAASAATGSPGPKPGSISGTVSFCSLGNPPPAGGFYNVVATPSVGAPVATVTDGLQHYSVIVPAGTYIVSVTPGPPGTFGGPTQTVPGVVVTAGNPTTRDVTYTATC